MEFNALMLTSRRENFGKERKKEGREEGKKEGRKEGRREGNSDRQFMQGISKT